MRLLPHQHSSVIPRRHAAGNALPAIIVLVALALSTVIFFVFTRPAMQQPPATDVAVSEPVGAPAVLPAPASSTPKPGVPSTTAAPAKTVVTPAPVASPKPKPAPPVFGFARPLDLGKELARSLTALDFEKAGNLATAADPAQAEQAALMFQKLLKDLGVKAGREDQVEVLGVVQNKTRLAVPLLMPGRDTPLNLQLDLERDDRMGWKVSALQLPKELAAALEAPSPPAAAPPGVVPSPATPAGKAVTKPAPKMMISVAEHADALTFGSDFVKALLRHDFVTAQALVDPKKVSAERLAGLCIVFEEGKYDLKPGKPLVITVASPEVSWIVAQVQSPSLQQSTEFGLELQRDRPDGPWRVVGLNLSEILASFASAAAKLGIPYTPIVTHPRGGESLALYFEYDQAALHPRAQKQLEIVAGLLKSDATRKLEIAGHTDAKGTDNYNLGLSQARAEAVKRQLVALGVPETQVVTRAMGKAQPLGPNQKKDGTDDPEGRSKNRRAEILLNF